MRVSAIRASVIGAAVVAALTMVVITWRQPLVSERAVIGLTAESQFPMHDSHLAATAGTLDDGRLVAAVLDDLGLARDRTRVELDRNRKSGNSIVAVVATAETSADAALLANTVADRMIDAAPDGTPVALFDRAAESPVEDPLVALVAALIAGAALGLLVHAVVAAPVDVGSIHERSPGIA